jgi:hypothetical protein
MRFALQGQAAILAAAVGVVAAVGAFAAAYALQNERAAPHASPPDAPGSAILVREGAMVPLADRGGGPRTAQLFGTSGRGPFRGPYSERRDGWGDDDDDHDYATGTYRTLCVRLCDGYYFPVSFSVLPDSLRRDRDICASRCGAQGRLYVHRSIGETPEHMVDLQGRPYRQLPTAFLYRSQYVPSCKCQPDPWEAASLDRHRAYALAAAASRGSKEAAKELQDLRARMNLRARTKETSSGLPPAPASGAGPEPSAAAGRQAEITRREDGGMMGLGSGSAPKAAPVPAGRSRSHDWTRSIFDPLGGR